MKLANNHEMHQKEKIQKGYKKRMYPPYSGF
jgi:hypothetical protein